jgi:hypothetical protein
MTRPKPAAHAARLQQLYTKLHAVETQIKQEEAHHQQQRRQQELQQVLVYGRLVLLAGLNGTAPEILLGMLWEGLSQMADTVMRQRWQTRGTEILAGDKRLQRTVQRLWPFHCGTGREMTDAAAPSDAPPTRPAEQVTVATARSRQGGEQTEAAGEPPPRREAMDTAGVWSCASLAQSTPGSSPAGVCPRRTG